MSEWYAANLRTLTVLTAVLQSVQTADPNVVGIHSVNSAMTTMSRMIA
jgi:hypothetical protein